MREHCTTAANKANRTLGYINKGISSRDKIVISLYSMIVRPHLEHCAQFWSLALKRVYGWVGEGPEEGHKDGQRHEKDDKQGKAEKTGFVQP